MPLADLANVLLDEPRWVETRWMLLEERSVVTGLSGDRRNFVATCTQRPLMVVVGKPEPAFIEDAAAGVTGPLVVLAAAEHGDHAAAALPRLPRTTAHIFGWPGWLPLPAAPDQSAARLLTRADLGQLGHVPRELREEIIAAAEYSPVSAAFAGGAPVAFCYACGITETLWDVSIDTLDGFRRRGCAMRAWQALAAWFGERHVWPAWGAVADNAASLKLAARLGFVPSGDLAYFERD